MANTDFSVLLKAELDRAGIDTDLKKVQEIVKKYHLELTPDLQTASLKNQFKSVCKEMANDFNKAFNANVSGNDVFKVYENKARQLQQTIEKANKIQLQLDAGDYDKKFAQLEASYRRLGLSTDEINQKTAAVSTALDNLKKKDLNTLVQDEKAFTDALKKSRNEASILKTDLDKIYNPAKQTRLSNDILNWLSKNTAASKEAREQLQLYYSQLQNGRVSVANLEKIEQAWKKIDAEQRGLGKLGKNLKDQLSQAKDSFVQWISVSSAVMALVYQMKKIPQEVYKIDTSMTNLYKVTDETQAKYEQFLDSSKSKAQKLGRSISGLVDQTANWAKLGYNIDEASKLAETSSVYANVGEVDDATAVSDIVTAIKAFNIEASNSIEVVDKLNNLGNKYATSSADLGEGLSKSASALALAGNDINKTLAMLTGGTEITQNSSEMGNSLKVLSMRIRGMKGELEELGEEYENVDSISKIQTQILNQTNGAVNIFDDEGNFRATYDILEDIAKVWDKISQTDQAALLETIAGKQRGNQVAALIQSFQSGQAQKAYNDAVNAEGSAMQEQERWMQSAEAKAKQFEASFQSLSQSVLDSDLLKWFIDFGTGTVNALDGVISGFNNFSSAITSLGGLLGEGNSTFGTLGAISGLLMNKAGIGERTMFQW